MSYKVYNWQLKMEVKHRLTQQRFMPYGTHPNSVFGELILCWKHQIIFTLTFNWRCIV